MFLNIDRNAKTVKGQKQGYITGILYLAPANASGINVCPFASKGCKSACLYNSGLSSAFKRINISRIKKTKALFADKFNFIATLEKEIAFGIRKAKSKGFKFVVRLNGTSDLSVETWGLMEKFPDTQFYDYTKNPFRMHKFLQGKMPKNYHLTFSFSEVNKEIAIGVLKANGNVAMVFRTRNMTMIPKKYFGFKVISGDKSDLRFKEKGGAIVGLTMKGSAQKDYTGFVQPCVELKAA